MNKIIEVNVEDLNPGDYIVTNFMYRDDKTGKDVPVECHAKVKCYIPDWNPNDYNNYNNVEYFSQPVIECEHLISTNFGIEPEDGTGDMYLGVGPGIDIRYMTEEEIVEFDKNFN